MDDDTSFDTSFGTPNCPRCLMSLEIAGTEQHPYWICPSCRTAFLTGVAAAL